MKKTVHHLCIQTNNYRESLAFYQTLGFEVKLETPDFHGRDYNSWLCLNDFYIELQTGKKAEQLPKSQNSEGIAHFCLWVASLEAAVDELSKYQDSFIQKEGSVIYQVAKTRLCKLYAPEGTIIELRDSKGI
ncbi:VOC family protein [Enterococcus sp. LJL51]|uniref:VOC family protein n=1 Tax=Enterococcus sp. LJL51 TaxID=3416656 RepID=UPI003CF2379D